MKIFIKHTSAMIAVGSSLLLLTCIIHYSNAVTHNDFPLTLDPMQSLHHAGGNASFTCSSPRRVALNWRFSGFNPTTHSTNSFKPAEGSMLIVTGVRAMPGGDEPFGYFSKLTIHNLKKDMSVKITCYVEERPSIAETASLVVHGVEMGSMCKTNDDCTANHSSCENGVCLCLPDYLLRLSQDGQKFCKKIVYRLYESCEFTDQCFQNDRRAMCSDGICVCSAWASNLNGKCVSDRDINYSKNQDLYRIGLVGITCLIIIVITVSLWLTLRKSCNNQSVESQLAMIAHNMNQNAVVDIPDDKPPSYDDALQSTETVNSPPNFFEALKSSTAARKLLRQVSAPAGQMLTKNTSMQPDPNIGTQVQKQSAS